MYDTGIDKRALARALLQFKDGVDPDALFSQREASRFMRKEGIPPQLAAMLGLANVTVTYAETGAGGHRMFMDMR